MFLKRGGLSWERDVNLTRCSAVFAGLISVFLGFSVVAQDDETEPAFNSISMVVLRSPDPVNLSKFYEALGMKVAEVGDNGAVFFKLEGEGELFEILNLAPDAEPNKSKTSRTQQSLVALLNVTNVREVARRAREAGSPLVEPLGDPDTAFVYYIADWEDNIVGFISPPSPDETEGD